MLYQALLMVALDVDSAGVPTWCSSGHERMQRLRPWSAFRDSLPA